jgi:hypothetical protein
LVWDDSFNFKNGGLQLLLLALPLHPEQLCRTPVQNFKRKNARGWKLRPLKLLSSVPDPYQNITDPDPPLFVSDIQDENKKLFLLITF